MSEDGVQGQPDVIAKRLNELFESCQPLGRPYTLREVVSAVNERAGRQLLSFQYLSLLRNGSRNKPSFARLDALARFFGVDVTYFSDDKAYEAATADLRLLAALRDGGVRHIALCAADLSTESKAMLADIILKIRRAEGLPDDPAGDVPPGD